MKPAIVVFVLLISITFGVLTGCGGSSSSDANSSPVISLNKTTLTFTAIEGGENPQSQSVTITNSGGGLLQVSAPADTERYSFTMTENSTNNLALTVSVNIAGLPAGVYTDAVLFGGDGLESRTISITLTIIAPALAKWTVMLYSMADTNLEKDMMADIEEMLVVGSTDEVNVITQIDRHSASDHQHQPDPRAHDYEEGVGNISDWTTAKRFKVLQNNLVEIADLGEVNSGDPDALSDFLLWAKENYPAEKYVLIMSDHGGSWPGFGGDDSHQGDSLTLDEMTTALEAAQLPLDIISFDACLMANLEVAYELTPFADILVASEELEPGHGWDYTAILNALKANPDQTPVQLGKVIVDSYKIHAETVGQNYRDNGEAYNDEKTVTLSVIDLARIDALALAVDQFASSVAGKLTVNTSTLDALWLDIADARSESEEYGDDPNPERGSNVVDLGHIIYLIADATDDAAVVSNANAVIEALNQAHLYSASGDSRPYASGLSIYFPYQRSAIDERYNNLLFAWDTAWPDMVGAYLSIEGFDTTGPEVLAPTQITATGIDEDGTSFVNIAAQFSLDTDMNDISIIVANSEGWIMGEVKTTNDMRTIDEVNETVTVQSEIDGSWLSLCSGSNNCIYAPFVELDSTEPDPNNSNDSTPTTSLFGLDIIYAPDANTNGIPAVLMLEYNWDTEATTVIGITPVREDGFPAKETIPVSSGNLIQVYFQNIVDGSISPGSTLTMGQSNLTIEFSTFQAGDYYIGYMAYDYAGNMSWAGSVLITAN